MRIFQRKILEEQESRFLFNNSPTPENPTCREIIWTKLLESWAGHRGPNMMQVHCMVHTYDYRQSSGCVIHNAFPLQQWLHEKRLNVTL